MEVSLDLAQGRRTRRVAAVDVGQRVVRVLPALVARAPAGVLDVAVAIRVAVSPAPLERGLRGWPQLVGELVVARPVLGLRERA